MHTSEGMSELLGNTWFLCLEARVPSNSSSQQNTICCRYEKESLKGRRLTRLVVIYPEKLMIMVPKS